MSDHTFVADGSVVSCFTDCTKREREWLLRVFQGIAEQPHQRGDWVQRSALGREMQVKRFGAWLVTFWTDDPVLEVRIVDIKKVGF